MKLSFAVSMLLALGSSKPNALNLQRDMTTITGGQGTIFLNGEWIKEIDPTAFYSVTPTGACERTMYDRRSNIFATT